MFFQEDDNNNNNNNNNSKKSYTKIPKDINLIDIIRDYLPKVKPQNIEIEVRLGKIINKISSVRPDLGTAHLIIFNKLPDDCLFQSGVTQEDYKYYTEGLKEDYNDFCLNTREKSNNICFKNFSNDVISINKSNIRRITKEVLIDNSKEVLIDDNNNNNKEEVLIDNNNKEVLIDNNNKETLIDNNNNKEVNIGGNGEIVNNIRTKKVHTYEKKKKKSSITIYLPKSTYDLRISISEETPFTTITNEEESKMGGKSSFGVKKKKNVFTLPFIKTFVRERERMGITFKEFRFDLTRVKAGFDFSKITYEVELEVIKENYSVDEFISLFMNLVK